MNSPSIRRRSWSGWPVSLCCCGVLIIGVVSSRTLAQEKSIFDRSVPFDARPLPSQRFPSRNGGAIIYEPNRAETLLTAQAPSADPTDVIAPATKPTAAPEFLPRLSPNEEKIQAALSDTTEVAFTDTPLEERLKFLEDLHSVEIWLDKETLTTQQINTDQPVNLQISGVSLRSALHLMLEPLSLSLVIEDQVLKITTKARADKAIITRTYPVSDLFSTRDEAEGLVESLVCGLGLVQKNKDGPTPLAVSVPSAAIVARLSRSQQEQLLQLLRDLREAKSLAPKRPMTVGDAPRFEGRTNDDGRESPKKLDGKIDEFSPGLLRPTLAPDDFNPRPRLRDFPPDYSPDPSFETPRKQPPPTVKPETKRQI